ncbi:hypothetical protein RchiOBHm_Chr4g0433811 [Rosa chinensis]|uniref:Uncharacterized protein n=1 Tax=Rosa chinensis TaxID=74649 RepID=A0A2P6R1D2_ROSCH|nr:hypothetical protein RchiOBHm_Chr4g0433811 [Rosa chinensis]
MEKIGRCLWVYKGLGHSIYCQLVLDVNPKLLYHGIKVRLPTCACLTVTRASRHLSCPRAGKKKEVMASTGNKMHDLLSYLIATADPVTGRFMPENEIANKIMGTVAASFNSPAMTTTFIEKFLGERPDMHL